MEAIPEAPPVTPKIEELKPEKPARPKARPDEMKAERPPKKKVKKAQPPGTETSPEKSPNSSQQLVLYSPGLGPSPSLGLSPGLGVERGVPSIGAFTVQCAACFKWRLIPTKEKYEEIREKILEVPFVCERAREWRPEVSCEEREDISQDGSRLWAIDKPQIPLPPPGWERLIHIRGEGCTRFADVYYAAPNGKKLRSLVEVQRFLDEHKDYEAQGVTLSRFSFQIPRPLHDNYVRKKTPNATLTAAAAAAAAANSLPLPGSTTPPPDIPLLPEDVQPISCFPPEEGSTPPAAATPPLANPEEHASLNPASNPPSNAKRKIVVKPPSRDKNPSPIDASSEVTMLDNPEPSQTELQNGTNAD